MKTLTQIGWVMVLAMLALANTASGQGIVNVALPVSSMTAGSTSNINVTLDVRKQKDVAVMLRFNCATATNVVPLTITFDKSVDGENWSDKDTFAWSYIRDGTTNSINATTNISVVGYPYLRLKTILNPGSVGAVNLESFKYYIKHETDR